MNKSVLFLAPLLAAFAASPVLADKGGNGKGKGKHHGKKSHVVHRDHHRDNDRVVIVDRDRPTVVVRDRDHDRRDYDRFDGRHDNGLHLGWYKQQWRRGDRIDWTVVQPTYYVYDYRAYDLRPAPVGYRWVRPMDDRYLLVEIASGLIVDALGY
jgi:Ni/Co efflux regulator RcnB